MTRKNWLPSKRPFLCSMLPLGLGLLLSSGCGQDESSVEYVGGHSFLFDVNEPMVGPVPSVSAFRGSIVLRRSGDKKVSIGISPSCTLAGTLSGGVVELSADTVTCSYELKFLPARCWLRSSVGEMRVTFKAPLSLSLTRQGKVSFKADVEIPADQDYLCKNRLGRSSYLFEGEESAL
jgi:hypothetical protein